MCKRVVCGVYFLIKDRVVVYVGQSVNVYGRVAGHAAEKEFDSWAFEECKKEDLDERESLYIAVFKPILNGNGGNMPTIAKIKLAQTGNLLQCVSALPVEEGI